MGLEEVYVENIEVDEIDPENAIYGEDGQLDRYQDVENNKVYIRGQKDPDDSNSDKSDPDDEGGAGDGAPSSSEDEEEEVDIDPELYGGEADEELSDEEYEVDEDELEDGYSNSVERLLKTQGYEHDTIKLEDGTEVALSDLTPEQQVEIMDQEYVSIIEDLESQLEEVSNRQPEEFKFEDENKQKFLDYLKKGGDIKELAKEILSKDPAARGQMLSDDEVVKEQLKKDYPEWSDEEIDEELQDLDEKKIARRAKAIRARWEKEGYDISDLAKSQEEKTAAEQLEAQNKHKEIVNSLIETAKSTEEIAGIKLNDNLRNVLLNEVVSPEPGQESPLQQLVKDPQAQLELAFYKKFGNEVLQKTAKYYYEKGLSSAGGGKKSDGEPEPIRTYASPKNKGSQRVKTVKSVNDLDDSLLDTDTF